MRNKKAQRQTELIRILKTQGSLPVSTLAQILGVSGMTIRRDLAELSEYQPEIGHDERTELNYGYNLFDALKKSNDKKNAIGLFAASLISPDDIIMIDTGSTTAKMIPHLPLNRNITVLCFNANVLFELRYKSGIKLLFCGGVFHKDTEMFESPESIQFINRIRANKVFLSAAGIHKQMGITCVNPYEVPTKKAIIHSSLQRILLVDSGKFNQIHPTFFCDLDDIQVIVTDKNLSEDWRNYILEKEITLHLV